jgi:hypothetical protein
MRRTSTATIALALLAVSLLIGCSGAPSTEVSSTPSAKPTGVASAAEPRPDIDDTPIFDVVEYGATGDGSTDDYDAIQAAINACTATGGVVYFPPGKTYLLNKADAGGLKLPPANSQWVVLSGQGATIRLTSNVPRFLDFDRGADHQSFEYFDVRGFTIDAGNVAGYHHIVLGAYSEDLSRKRMTIRHIRVQDVRAFNVPASAGNPGNRVGIHISCYHAGEGVLLEPVKNYIEDIRVQGYRQEGGNNAVYVCGEIGDFADQPADSQIELDEVHVQGVWFDSGLTAAEASAASPIQIGGRARGGRVTIRNCYVRGSGDNCTEVDSVRELVYENVVAEEARNHGFYFRNQACPLGVDFGGDYSGIPQVIVYRDCVYRQGSGTGNGFSIGESGRFPVGSVSYEDCQVYDASSSDLLAPGWSMDSRGVETTAAMVQSYSLRACAYTRTNHVVRARDSWSKVVRLFLAGTPNGDQTPVLLDGVRIRVETTHRGNNAYVLFPIAVDGVARLHMRDCQIDLDGIDIPEEGFRHVSFGLSGTPSNVSALIEGCTFTSSGSRGTRVLNADASPSTLTIEPAIVIRRCDWSDSEDASQTIWVHPSQADKVILRANAYPTGAASGSGD